MQSYGTRRCRHLQTECACLRGAYSLWQSGSCSVHKLLLILWEDNKEYGILVFGKSHTECTNINQS